ncbi:MAG: GNAT family N-acetyltransferase, partial [Cellvibrionales bacterium]|nr:GNAT family N-acetyltransferase [Cellvibrionales bacterium]
MNNKSLGPLIFKRFSLHEDLPLFHSWVTQGYAKYWGMTGHTLKQVKTEYKKLLTDGHTECYFGYMNVSGQVNSGDDVSAISKPVCFMETYDPNQSPLTHHTEVEAGDVGFHILLAPNDKPIPGFGKHVFGESIKFLFEEKNAKRILVEPDVGNDRIHKLNREFGFHHQKRIQLENKTAYLGICHKRDFEFACKNLHQIPLNGELDLTDHNGFTQVNRHLVKKGLTEFLHERILTAKRISSRSYEITTPDSGVSYLFTGEEIALEHLIIDTDSITRSDSQGNRLPLAITHFILDFADILGLKGKQLRDYLEEVNSTVYSLLFKIQQGKSSSDLVNADFQTVEQAMIEGHPIFIANSGRIGFDTQDFINYSPEAANPLSLLWLAAQKTRCELSLSEGLTYDSLIETELDATDRDRFEAHLKSQGVHPNEYYYLPIHPWQWTNKIQQLYTSDLVDQSLIYLGETQDRFQPQQSIRTFFNQSQFGKRYIKVA